VIASVHRVLNSGEHKRLRVIGTQPPVLHIFEAAGLAGILEPDRRVRPRTQA
jgi:hypothetical protein